jgi:glycosyltransferase involved in cell wall biosynthesis
MFWSPAHYAPFYIGSPLVVTVHDLAYEYFPELFLPRDLYKLKHWTRDSVARARAVIAVSEATKNDLVKLYGTDPTKITVIHNGYDTDLFNTDTVVAAASLKNWQLKTGNYLLFLGTLQPRKNVIRLIQAFHLLKEQGYHGKLVLAGGVGWLAEETLQVINNSPDRADIVTTGYVSDATRKALYTHAEVYVLPSLYEGFGVPAIEAMACGAPVAVANNSSLPEVVGDAGVLFDAHDPADIARAVREIQADRSAWVKRSLARARAFSWDKCAKETGKVLQTTISQQT